MTLNLACGHNKISGTVNIDLYMDDADVVKLDIFDIDKEYKADSIDAVYLFHAIEHQPEARHRELLDKIWKVLKPGGKLICTFPEFVKCAQNYIDNYKGRREFWKATLYGRQLQPGDFHVALMDSRFFKLLLLATGFDEIEIHPELKEDYNTVVKSVKSRKPPTKEEIYKQTIFGV